MPDKTRAILEAILETLPEGWRSEQLYIGVNWTISIVRNEAGEQRAGLAACPAAEVVTAHRRFRHGPTEWGAGEALPLARLALSVDPVEATLGLATTNALLKPDPALLEEIDAGDWLVEHGRGRKIAVIGRFPFASEDLREVAERLWIFELKPKAGEHSPTEFPEIIPQADILAITSTTLINHTLAGILAWARPDTRIILLGPSTPLTPVLFEFGIDLLSGVQVINQAEVIESLREGVSFRKLAGVRRVTLLRPAR
jgi:uncharacterized protein (DUF4213/DUF364 family)